MSSKKIVNVNNGEYNNSVNVNLWENQKKEYQKFDFTYDNEKKSYMIRAVHSDKALDVEGAKQNSGTNVQQYESNNTDAQRWIIKKTDDGYYYIVSKCNELFLDISEAKTTNGSNIQVYAGNGTKAQKFNFIKADVNVGNKTLENGNYNIIPKIDNNKAIQVEGQSIADKQKIQLSKKLSVYNESQGFKIEYLNNGYYSIKSLKSDKPIEVENGTHFNGTKIQQNQNNYYKVQQWIIKEAGDGYYYIVSRCNGLYVDIPNGKAEDGLEIQMYDGNNTSAQKFKFEIINNRIVKEKTVENGCYIIKSKLDNNKVLDISQGSFSNNANLQIWDKSPVQQQKFQVKYNSEDKHYEIQSINSGKYLDVLNDKKSDGTNVQQYEKNGSMAQKWAINKADDESFYIVALNSNLYLDISGGNTVNGTNVQIYEGNESNAQKFIFEPIPVINDNEYKILTKVDLDKCLDISEGSIDDNANLQIWELDNVNQQVYRVENINENYCKIIAKHSDKVLTVSEENNVVQATFDDKDNQKWIIESAGEGFYKIKSKSTDLYIDVCENNSANGTNVQVNKENNSIAQMFRFNTLTTTKGIDVSSYNGDINWEVVRQFGNINYAIIRAGYRGYRNGRIVTDTSFVQNVQGARNNSIDIGLYFYTQATNTQEAVEEANYVINLVRQYNLQLKYPIFIDTERSTADENNPGRADNLDVNTRTAVCKSFCNTIKNNGYIPGIYASKNWFYNNLDESQLSMYDIWIAHYTGNENDKTDYRHKYDMWQYTSHGFIPGISSFVDRNVCYKIY